MPLNDMLDRLPPDGNDDLLRARLSPPALRAYQSVCAGWQLTAVEGRRLLGVPAEIPLPLTGLRAIAAILAIHADLRHVHGEGEAIAGAWLRTPNPLPPFAGRSPLALMTQDGEAGFQALLAFLHGWRE